ncbi:PEF-CTERM sorting domain-containing protein [Methanosarcina sp.]|uniref:PEF-CTERM sorting domain-containing protein n=1 Tax=Methanosarcina sp. TaxID=2213 RepID=UPI002BB8CE18|nr:PEF-CTERM sorting domain-containing protein [Methanosarcina sp.]HOW15469.1 PEF-CTERM sorting domain-containing protein [Methanosarcina sp.]
MKTSFLLIIMMLIFAAIMVMPASAGEVTITFDEGRVQEGAEIGSAYSDMGVTFSSGAKIVETNELGSWFGYSDLGFYNPSNYITTITFSPVVRSVSIDFENSFEGNMDALLVNGEVLSKSKCNFFWVTEKRLRIESNDISIQSVSLSGDCPYVNSIKFNNLVYDQVTEPTTQVPEFPTVALPVAALIGMIFIFQRRKD